MGEVSSGAKEKYQEWLRKQTSAQRKIEKAVREKLGDEAKFILGKDGIITTESDLPVGKVTKNGKALIVDFRELGE